MQEQPREKGDERKQMEEKREAEIRALWKENNQN